MKRIKAIVFAIMAIFATIMTMPALQAKTTTLTPEMRKAAVVELRKQLPTKVTDGMTWTKCDLTQDAKTMIWTFKVNPREMGSTLSAVKAELNSYSDKKFRALLGDDFQEVLDTFNCPIQIVLVFPDNTTKKFLLR